MSRTKKLLSITNLKKYFPIAKSSIFQKEQLYVRANEDITLDIYEGETLGVVGESGCGKSTLGRVLLQLYPQTAGSTFYYGVTLEDFAPAYVVETLRHYEKYCRKIQKAEQKRNDLDRQVEAAGGVDTADFFLLQNQNLARCDYETALGNVVKIVGGFYAMDPNGEGRSLILRSQTQNIVRNRYEERLQRVEVELERYNHKKKPLSRCQLKAYDSYVKHREAVLARMKTIDASLEEMRVRLEELRVAHASNEEFAKYEKMRETGIDLSRLTYNEIRVLRKDLQIIFQDPYSSLNPRFTIGQIIEEGLLTHHFYHRGSPKMREHVVETMEKCGLQEYMLHRYPHQFSGGQRQRISIARALAVNPKFIVCDESVSALDVSIQSQIINLLQELKEKEKLTYMFISHDLSVVRYISDRICVMYLGNVVELADAATMFDDPRHPYTVALLSSIPTTDMESLKKERILLEGNIPSPIRPPSGCKFHTRCYMACDKCKRVPPPLTEIEPGHFVACHFPERKLDENGNYLFEVTATEKKSKKVLQEEK